MATIIGNNMPQDFSLPPIPPGFVLDEPAIMAPPLLPPVGEQLQQPVAAPQDFSLPPIPPGFVLDEPAAIGPQVALAPEARIPVTGIPAPIQPQALPSPAEPLPEEPQGFFGRTAESLQQRGANLADIFGAGTAQLPQETIIQTVATELGALGDIIGQGVVSATKLLPDAIKEPVVAGVQSFLNTNAGKAGIKALSKGVKNWEGFKERNPRAARDIEAIFNIGAFFIPVKGISAARLAKGGIKGARKGIRKATTKAPVVTADDLATLGSNEYKNVSNLRADLGPNFSNKYVKDLEKFIPQTEIGKQIAGDSPFTQIIERIKGVKGKTFSLQAAQEFDELLGDAVDDFTEVGRLTKQGKKILDIQTLFRESIEKATPDMIEGDFKGFAALKKARKLWAASRRLDDVERILAKAEFSKNKANSIQTGFANLVNNEKRIRGFNKKEIALMKKTAKTGVVSDIFRVTVGSRLLPIITAATGGFGATTAATAASLAARGGATRVTVRQAEAVARAVARRGLEPEPF